MRKLPCALLVDDDTIANYLNRLLLTRMGVADKLLVAQNGREALDLLRQHCDEENEAPCPVLILLDVKMPVMDGFEFLEAYEQLPAAHRHPNIVVMLSTSLHPQDVERVQQLRIAGFLNKPLTEAKVTEVMDRHFGVG